MSSSKDFLNKMREAGEEFSEDPVFLTVAKMRVQFGYSGFVTGERPANFFKPYGEAEDAERVSNEVAARLKEIGSKRGAVFAVLLDIPEQTNTGEKVTWDIQQVTFTNNEESSEYQILFNALAEGNFPINEWFWGSYKNEVVGTYEKDGETKKRYLSLPVEKFDNEVAALASVDSNGPSATDASKWSDLARATFEGNMKSLEKSLGDISDWYNKVYNLKEEMPSYPTPDPLTPVSVKRQIADAYMIETSDVDIAINEVPF